MLTERFNSLKGIERDKFYKVIEPITSETTKGQIWENNHIQITCAIATLMQEYGRMPSKSELAVKTGISRPTITKHLKEYPGNPIYLAQMEQFNFMAAKVLTKVFHFAVNGDMAAAKLYFSVIGNTIGQPVNNTLIQNQNNYIQINGTVLSQETIKQLNPEQLLKIEGVINGALVKSAQNVNNS